MNGLNLSAEIEALKAEDEGVTFHVHGADGSPLYLGDEPVTLTVAGTYSKRYRRALDAKISKAGKSRKRELEDIQRDALEVTADCVLGWSCVVDSATNQPLECTRDNVVKALTALVWLREQVEAKMDDHASFSAASSVI